MPAFYTSGQSSNPRRNPTCWASWQRSHTVSSMPCHGAWTPAPPRVYLSTECECTASQIETPFLPAAQQLIISLDNNNIRAAHWADQRWNAEWADNPTRLRTFIPDTGTQPPRSKHLPRDLVRPSWDSNNSFKGRRNVIAFLLRRLCRCRRR